MTTYSTRTLAEAIIGEDTKAATRELRKFLRDELGEGKAVVGKGGRYSLDLTKREVTAMTKKFKTWGIAQEEAKAARRAALDALKAPSAATTDEDAVSTDEVDEAESDKPLEGPTDEEIAMMLSDDDETVDEA